MIYNVSLINSSFKFLIGIAFTMISVCAFAQTDSTMTQSVDTTAVIEVDRGTVTGNIENVSEPSPEAEYFHSPKKATILSAVLPGAGQVYNKKYWKVPILYAGFAVTGYFLNDNLKNIDKYKKAYIAITDDDPNTSNETDIIDSNLLDAIDLYKTWRDLSYISFAVIYALNIIDANVDAHLFYFDVSEDISLNITPYFSPFRSQGAGISLSLKL